MCSFATLGALFPVTRHRGAERSDFFSFCLVHLALVVWVLDWVMRAGRLAWLGNWRRLIWMFPLVNLCHECDCWWVMDECVDCMYVCIWKGIDGITSYLRAAVGPPKK
jgi:hypothetical protein